MADKNQLKIADQVDLADDDPFAELTRIMGFDPRQPARQPQPPAPAVEEVSAEHDDFSLDLEKELLGGFDMEDEQVFAQEAFVGEEAAVEPAEAVHAEPEAAEVDFDFSGDFDAAMAAPDAFEAAVPGPEPELSFDGDLDAAFATAAAGHAEPVGHDDEFEFDLVLSDEDARVDGHALDETPVARAPLPVTPEAVVAAPHDIDADFDAAMADIDMDFLHDAPESVSAPEPAAAALPVEPADILDVDLNLFGEHDFHLDDEPMVEARPALQFQQEVQPEIDDSAFQFGDDVFRLDDVSPSEEHAARPVADEFSFDDVDFGAGLAPEAVETEAPSAEPAAAPARIENAAPQPAAPFELSVPAYVPRKLPTSPMDIAAEEFRQREAVPAAPEPAFNLEDELNALLGNIRPGHAPVAAVAEAIPSYQPPVLEPQAYRSPVSTIFGSAAPAYAEPSRAAPEPIGFDAPEHPADIDDNLNWELDEAFATEAEPELVEEELAAAYDEGEDGQFDGYAEEPAAEYAPEAEDYQAPVDLDDMFGEFSADSFQPQPELPYRDALAGVAAGATARFGGGAEVRPQTVQATGLPGSAFGGRVPERFAHRQEDTLEPAGFSPHRDPVVRGNPLKEDPLDIITQLAEKYSRKEPATAYGRDLGIATGAASASFGGADDIDISDAFVEQPDIETIEVGDRAIALDDDLDIPELPEEEDAPQAAAYDDLDAEFSSLLSDMNAAEAQSGGGRADPLAGGFGALPYETRMPAAAQLGVRQEAQAYHGDIEQDFFALDRGDMAAGRPASDARYADEDYQYDPDIDQEMVPAHLAAQGRRPAVSRGMLLAGAVGAVALLGAIGAFAFSFGGGEDAPAIVRADESPVKVRPENPGGTAVPNQESKVYQTVAGEDAATEAPQQEKLVTTTEEPMEVAPPVVDEQETAGASGKSEDRIEQILDEAAGKTDDEIAAVAPRKVRTMVVKPDGTLVPREDDPAATTSNEQTEAISAATPDAAPAPAIPEATGALQAAREDAPQATETAAPAEDETAAPADAEVAAAMPETAPVAPLRPADQPVDVVGEVKPDQVAAATTAAAAGGGWAMQIASQPSEAAAKSSYQDLARRYGAVLEGREVNIVKAEIAGKGTFWRVRVPAASRNEAIGLCENYKAAGGNCFVSK